MPREVPAMRNIFWQTLKKNILLLVVLIAAIIASIAVSVTPPLILQYIVDSLVSGSFSAYPLLTAGILSTLPSMPAAASSMPSRKH